jgi:tetratricopeptide (TPR) repeat protein
MQERRAGNRVAFCLPVQVTGRNFSNNLLNEVGQTKNGSSADLCFKFTTMVREGELLKLSLNMPPALRRFQRDQETYQVYARVARVNIVTNRDFEIGVIIIGEHPPADARKVGQVDLPTRGNPDLIRSKLDRLPFSRYPISCYSAIKPTILSDWKDANGWRKGAVEEKRDQPRFDIAIEAALEFFNEAEQLVAKEDSFINNISKNGASIISSYVVEAGDKIRIAMKSEDFLTFATVRAAHRIAPGNYRLHLEFINKEWAGNASAPVSKFHSNKAEKIAGEKLSHSQNRAATEPAKFSVNKNQRRRLAAAQLYCDGIELYEVGRYPEAAIAFRQAVERAPERDDYWHQLGKTYCLLPNNHKLAELALRQALQFNALNPDYALDLGFLYEKYGAIKKAELMYKRALKLDPDNKSARLALTTLLKKIVK